VVTKFKLSTINLLVTVEMLHQENHTESTYTCLWSHNSYKHSERCMCCSLFSVMVDEATDAANEEQLAVSVFCQVQYTNHRREVLGLQ